MAVDPREREAWLRRFHDARPGITSRAFERGGSYDRLAERVPAGRVLDLACGDGPLRRRLGARCVGLDVSRAELAAAGGGVQGRAAALPFADASFDAVACHLAFMLFDAIETVAAELHRVLRPGGAFHAVLGGGPTAEVAADDQFHRFLALLAGEPPARTGARLGDPRAKSEAGWRTLFPAPTWEVRSFERWELDLGGTFDEVWSFLGSSYEVADLATADRLREAMRFPGRRPCRVVVWLATAVRR